jgi:hypothetical protein
MNNNTNKYKNLMKITKFNFNNLINRLTNIFYKLNSNNKLLIIIMMFINNKL